MVLRSARGPVGYTGTAAGGGAGGTGVVTTIEGVEEPGFLGPLGGVLDDLRHWKARGPLGGECDLPRVSILTSCVGVEDD